MEIVAIIIVISSSILCCTLSTSFNQCVKDKYGQGCINWWWSACIAALLAVTLFAIGESVFWIYFSLILLSAVISAWSVYWKMAGWGATSKEALLGSLAQVASAIGITLAIIFVLFIFSGRSNKRKHRK